MKRISLVPALCVSAIFGAVACGGPVNLEPGEEEGVGSTAADLSVVTRGYNAGRTGANLSETVLTAGNVTQTAFGRRFQLSVDDQIYAGLLFVAGVVINSVPRNVVYVATVNNSVYAFDADTGGAPLWSKNFNGSARPANHTDMGLTNPDQTWCNPNYNDFTGNIGIVGTPVIDAAAGTIYFVSRTVTGSIAARPSSDPTNFVQRLHALNIADGSNRAGSPAVIARSVTGSGDGSSGGSLAFNARIQNQRAALGLNGNTVYVAWSGHCDVGPYHGWVMGFDKNSLGVSSSFVTTNNGAQGGIWQSGGGPLIDSGGNLYYATGNGWGSTGRTSSSPTGFTNGMVKLSSTLGVQSSFLASDWFTLNGADNDVGSGGPSFVPGTNDSLIFTGSKMGMGYLLRASNLTTAQTPFQVVFNQKGSTKHVHSSSTYWQSPQGLNMYVWGENDNLRVYRFNTSSQTFATTRVLQGSVLAPYGSAAGMPGGFMTISANNSNSGTGILWAAIPQGDANHSTVQGSFRAFNAETLAQLFDSNSGTNNGMGNLAKYNPPLVAQGRVYVPSFSNQVSVYGLAAAPPPPPPQGPFSGTAPALPAQIQAEDYDVGGEGVAYHDTDAANNGGQYRTDAVDIELITAAGESGTRDVGWIAQGEWLEYTVNSPGAGTTSYTMTARTAAMTAGGQIGVSVDGGPSTNINITAAGGFQSWSTTAAITVSMSQGNHVVRLTSNNATGFNLNWINFASGSPPPPPPPGTYLAEADTYAKDGSPTTNCNTATACGSTTTHQLEIKTGAANLNRETFIRFGGVSPSSSSASNATLRLCTFDPGTAGEYQDPTVSRSVIVEGIANDSWGETSLTWNNRPTDAGQNPVTLTVTGGGTCLNFNVTTFVNAQLQGGDHSISFRVKGLAADARRTIFSGRSASSNVPQLTVTN